MPFAATQRVTRYHLNGIYTDFGFKVGAEVGVSKGKHSRAMLAGVPQLKIEGVPGLKLFCVDPYIAYRKGRGEEVQNHIYEVAQGILAPYNAELIRKTSMDAVREFDDESLDFVYIDGNHKFDFVMMDLIFWAQKVKKGGIVALHDYCHFYWSGVVKAVDAYTYCHDVRPWYITKESKPTAFWVKYR
jgi:hypothetical protein